MFAAKLLHAAEEGDAVGAAAVAAEAFEQQVGDLGRDSVLEAFGFFVSAGPFEADYVGEQFFCEAVAQDEMLGDFLAFRREFDLAAAADAEVAAAGHALECSGDGGRRDAEVLGESGADGGLLFLDELPDGFKVIFLRDAGFFAAQVASIEERAYFPQRLKPCTDVTAAV